MKKYYARNDAVASISVTGGKLTKKENELIESMLVAVGLKEVDKKEYMLVKSRLPKTVKKISARVGHDGEVVVEES